MTEMTTSIITEREITEPVELCLPNGRLNPDAVGWTRRALHTTNLRGWGRNKRFEYWAITGPDYIVVLNISHHDYRSNVAIAYQSRSEGELIQEGGNIWFPRTAPLSDEAHPGALVGRRGPLTVRLTENAEGVALYGDGERLQIDLQVLVPEDHDSMGVVVPWSSRRFQYTKKDNCLRVRGTFTVDGVEHTITPEDPTYAVHDRGRGKWPYFTLWNWAAGCGIVDGHEIGLQFGGKWTDGTPSTENWIRIDGRLTKISEHLEWRYDPKDWMAPWHIRGHDIEVTLEPYKHDHHLFNRVIVLNRGDQVFGIWRGRVRDADGVWHSVDGLEGHTEEVQRRW